MKYVFALLFLSGAMSVAAQQTPWSGLPAQKKAMDISGNDLTVFLVVDTLPAQGPGEASKDISSRFYFPGKGLIGYGYRDATGRPIGLWKYFQQQEKTYQLYCEGYYTMITAARLEVAPDVVAKFPLSTNTETKQKFIQMLTDKFFFSGEWRFYNAGKLDEIIVMDTKVLLPYDVSVQPTDNGAASIEQLNMVRPWHRLTGNVLLSATFSKDGYMQVLNSNAFRCRFDAQGKMIVDPLPVEPVLNE